MKQIVLLIISIIAFNIGFSQVNLSSFEYWFDADIAERTTQTMSMTQTESINQSVSTLGLNSGIHILSFRIKDENGLYSSIQSSFFYKLDEGLITPNQIESYEYWFDTDYENKVAVSLLTGETLSILTDITTISLNNGMHIFNFRVKDENGLYSVIQSSFFYKLDEGLTTPNQIESYEYWFDTDYENKVAVSLSTGETISILTDITTISMNTGMHIFNFRVKDEKGLYSAIQSSFFYKLDEGLTTPNQIESYEYWFDTDYENKVAVSLSTGETLSILTDITTVSLNTGIHILNFRVKDEKGLYSVISSGVFYKLSDIQEGEIQIVAYEYWFDEDFESRIQIDMNSGQEYLQLDLSIETADLTVGLHRCNLRFKDNHNNWSVVQTQFFMRHAETFITNNELTKWRYWVDDNFVESTELQSPSGLSELFIFDNLDFTHVVKGQHTINCQFKDLRGQWSVVITDTIEKISLPIAEFTQFITANCDSTIVQFENQSIDGDVFEWTFGDGEISSDENPEHVYYILGDYLVTLTVRDTLTNVDSTASEIIHVNTNTFFAFETSECEEFVSPSGNYTWGMSGVYNDTIPNSMGCDSILTIDLIILEISETEIYAESCDEYVSPSGNYIWTTSGDYTDTLTNINMCDSIITVHLQINPTQNVSISIDGCGEYISPSGNSIWTESGSYTDTIPTIHGCDSIIDIELNIIDIDNSLTVDGDTIISNDAFSDYQWVDCDNNWALVDGETEVEFIPTESGSYAVILTHGDCVDTSDCVEIIVGALPENHISYLSVFPNPASDRIHIEMKGLKHISVYDMNGKTIFVKEIESEILILDVSGWAAGVYNIVGNGLYGTENKKIIINAEE
jgi:PKD repeat protein